MGSQENHTSSSRLTAMSPHQVEIIKSTAPILQTHGVDITTHFYKRILDAHPELRNVFNSTHQTTGAQPTALAHAAWAYATNIDNLGALGPAVSRIAQKHASLGVHPEQYPVVGEHLLASMREVLGNEIVTQPVLDAWAVAYSQLANIFINAEKSLYEEAMSRTGGWNGWRSFCVERKVRESEEIVSFYLVPADKMELPTFKPGQFISVRCLVPELGVYQPRQYSLSDTPAKNTYFRISVKREAARGEELPAGRISNYLHEHTPEGAFIDVSMPYGEFVLDVQASTPVVLISAGVGLTPMMSMLKTIVSSSSSRRRVLFVHAARNKGVHAMNDDILEIMAQTPQVERLVFYKDVKEGEDVLGTDYDAVGRVDILSNEDIRTKVLIPNADYYICGPKGFMDSQVKAILKLGVAEKRVHWEVFGVTS